MINYIAFDNPTYSPKVCLLKSKQLMIGKRFNLFTFDLVFYLYLLPIIIYEGCKIIFGVFYLFFAALGATTISPGLKVFLVFDRILTVIFIIFINWVLTYKDFSTMAFYQFSNGTVNISGHPSNRKIRTNNIGPQSNLSSRNSTDDFDFDQFN